MTLPDLNLWLAAFALAADWELVTIDKGFSQFADLKLRVLNIS